MGFYDDNTSKLTFGKCSREYRVFRTLPSFGFAPTCCLSSKTTELPSNSPALSKLKSYVSFFLEIGIGLIVVGAFFYTIGVMFFLDRALLAIGNVSLRLY